MLNQPLRQAFCLTDINLVVLLVINNINGIHVHRRLLYLRQLAESYTGMMTYGAIIHSGYYKGLVRQATPSN